MTDTTTWGPDAPDLHMLTGAYALGAVDDVEGRAFERHLAGCEACREEVRGFAETAARLADAVAVPPPSAVRDRVLAQVRTTPQLPPVALPTAGGTDAVPPVAPSDPPGAVPATRRDGGGRRRPASRPGWLVAAAVAAVLALGAGVFGAVQFRQAQDLRRQQEVALAQQREVASVLADPARRLVSGPVASGGTVTVALAGGRAVVLTAGVSGLPSGRTYQLWVIRPDGIRSLGLGPAAASAAGSWTRPLSGVRPGDTVAVSVEPLGGSPQPTTTPVAAIAV